MLFKLAGILLSAVECTENISCAEIPDDLQLDKIRIRLGTKEPSAHKRENEPDALFQCSFNRREFCLKYSKEQSLWDTYIHV